MTATLAVRLGGLGDLLVALPALNLLRPTRLGRRVTLLADPRFAGLLRESGAVEAVASADAADWRGILGAGDGIPSPVPDPAARFDLVIGWFRSAAPAAFGSSLRAAGRPRFVAFEYEAASGLPMSRYFYERTAEFLRGEGEPRTPFERCARLGRPRLGGRRAPAPPYAVIHPGSGSVRKRWPLDRFLGLAARLRERGLGGYIVTGEAEEALEPALEAADLPAGWSRLRRPALAALAELLRGARLYLGNDSGVTHLAAACGTRGLAFFLEENLPAWQPVGRIRALAAASLEDLTLGAAAGRLEDVLRRKSPKTS